MKQKYLTITIWLSLAISVLVHFSSWFDEFISNDFTQKPLLTFMANAFVELLITSTICLALFLVNFYILKPLEHQAGKPKVRFFVSLLVSLILVLVLSHQLYEFKGLMFPRTGRVRPESVFVFKDIFVTLVVITSIYVIRVNYQNQQNKLEIQNLKIENLQRQFEALKNQVSPHFLFNSLSSLKTLINESPEVAQEYLTHLSSVLRYTLQVNESKLVSLADELKFVDSYYFLIKLRFTKNINLVQNIDEKALSAKIPPLALQILLENAIKHNEISKRNNLEISISTVGKDSLIVSNKINKKIGEEPSSGIGLSNLANQYRILGNQEISIRISNEQFTVEIPLLS